MRLKLPKYVHAYMRRGKPYYYLRAPGKPPVRLKGAPYSPTFMAAYDRGLGNQVASPRAPQSVGAAFAGQVLPNSIDEVIVAYYKSPTPHWGKLGPATAKKRRIYLEKFRGEYGTRDANAITPNIAKAWLNALESYHIRRNWFQALKGLFAYAVERDPPLMDHDPLANYRMGAQPETDGHHDWTEEEIAQYRAHHPLGTKPRLYLELLLNFGARKGDALKLGPKNVVKGFLSFSPGKTKKFGTEVKGVRLLKPFEEALAAMPPNDNDTFIAKTKGEAYSEKAFGNYVREWCDAAGLPQCASHGLRKACARRMAEAGASENEIMSVLGHKTSKMAQLYLKMANRSIMAGSAMDKVEARLARMAKLVEAAELEEAA